MGNGQEWSVGKLLGTSSAYWRSSTVHAAVRLDVFSVIGEGKLTAEEVSEKIGATSPRGIVMLLNALTAMGLLQHENNSYKNTAFSRSCLIKGEPAYVGYIIMHHHHIMDGWSQLHEAVIQGAPVEQRSYGEEAERESFQLGMFNLAMAIAPSIAAEISLEGKHHLLDLGGGPGTHAIHFCLANPGLKATIFDRKTTEPFTRKISEQFGVSDRINFIAGDFNSDPLGGPYDVAWLSQILHSNSYEQCQSLIEKTVNVLEPGGLIFIHDFLLYETMDGPVFPALFSLNMLLNNEGRSYSEKEIGEMLSRAGVRKIKRLSFRAPNDSAIICGTV
ncbi:MAG: SAM-dependent methyltransferase [Deltaproteobacteria bacterium]|nr:SAM-dependent methyltransferase [Deltaproteobacteria bacterium]